MMKEFIHTVQTHNGSILFKTVERGPIEVRENPFHFTQPRGEPAKSSTFSFSPVSLPNVINEESSVFLIGRMGGFLRK